MKSDMTNEGASSSPGVNSVSAPRRAVRSRFRPDPDGGVRLNERDTELLAALYLHHAMTREQVQELHFGSVRRCNARLRQLFDHGFVSRYYLPAAPYGAQAVYSIGRNAASTVARRLEVDLADVRMQIRQRTPLFLEHTLQIVEFYLALRRAAATHGDVEIERWVTEMQCRHEYEIRASRSGGWRKEVFNPDGFVRLIRRGTEEYRSYFVEIDLGHTSSRQFLGKLCTHRRYMESGLFADMFGGSEFKTLVVTTSPKRAQNLMELVREQQSDLFWFTTLETVREHGALASIWTMPAGGPTRGLV